MKTLSALLAICVLTAASCSSAIRDDADKDTENLEARASLPREAEPEPMQPTDSRTVGTERDLVGYWVGMFDPPDGFEPEYSAESEHWNYSNKINLAIDSLGGGVVVGHSVVAGNLRPFRGTYAKSGDRWVFEAKEPGDDPNDGTFRFEAATGDTAVRGTWTAYKSIKIPKRQYALTKQRFAYNPTHQLVEEVPYVDWLKTQKTRPPDADAEDDYYDISYFSTTILLYEYNASAQKLSRDVVANLTKADLFVLRNAIYARHGYSFKNRQLRAFFDAQPWYIPLKIDVRDQLTEIEKENISLLLKFEKHAKEYYDEFGRG